MMKNEGAFPDGHDAEDHQVRAALDLYFRTCSLEMNCLEMATAVATLANGGVCPLTLERVQSPRTVRNALSLMHSCGMYDYSGEFAFSIGVPAKSGVGGAVLLVVPGIMGICIWSPRLDRVGNSVRGVEMARRLSSIYTLHMYDAHVRQPGARQRSCRSARSGLAPPRSAGESVALGREHRRRPHGAAHDRPGSGPRAGRLRPADAVAPGGRRRACRRRAVAARCRRESERAGPVGWHAPG